MTPVADGPQTIARRIERYPTAAGESLEPIRIGKRTLAIETVAEHALSTRFAVLPQG
jgi:hypothetical protein